jgi:hypothetical protein
MEKHRYGVKIEEKMKSSQNARPVTRTITTPHWTSQDEPPIIKKKKKKKPPKPYKESEKDSHYWVYQREQKLYSPNG